MAEGVGRLEGDGALHGALVDAGGSGEDGSVGDEGDEFAGGELGAEGVGVFGGVGVGLDFLFVEVVVAEGVFDDVGEFFGEELDGGAAADASAEKRKNPSLYDGSATAAADAGRALAAFDFAADKRAFDFGVASTLSLSRRAPRAPP